MLLKSKSIPLYLLGGLMGSVAFLILGGIVLMAFYLNPTFIGQVLAIPTAIAFHGAGKSYINFYDRNGYGFSWLYEKTIGGTSFQLVKFLAFWVGLIGWIFFVDDEVRGNYSNFYRYSYLIIVGVIVLWYFIVDFILTKVIKNISFSIATARLAFICILGWQIFVFALGYFNYLNINWFDRRGLLMVLGPFVFCLGFIVFKWVRSSSK